MEPEIPLDPATRTGIIAGIRANIGVNIFRLRKGLGLTQVKLAAQVGVSTVSLGQYENGLCIPRACTQQRLAGALGVDMKQLLGALPSAVVAEPIYQARLEQQADLVSLAPQMGLTPGERIRRLRKKQGWSQQELADRLGVSAGIVSRYETQRSKLAPKHVQVLNQLLGPELRLEESTPGKLAAAAVNTAVGAAVNELINERIRTFIYDYEQSSLPAFAQKLDVSQSLVTRLFSKRPSAPSLDLVQRMAAYWPELRLDWLLVGRGPMLKSEQDFAPDFVPESAQDPSLPPYLLVQCPTGAELSRQVNQYLALGYHLRGPLLSVPESRGGQQVHLLTQSLARGQGAGQADGDETGQALVLLQNMGSPPQKKETTDRAPVAPAAN